MRFTDFNTYDQDTLQEEENESILAVVETEIDADVYPSQIKGRPDQTR